MVVESWSELPEELIKHSFRACGQAKDGTVEEITCMKPGQKAEAAFDRVKEIWDQASESFDRKVDTALDKCIVPEDSHIENELYLIDTDDESWEINLV